MATTYPLILFDFHGTLFKDPTEEPVNKAIGYAVLAEAKQAMKHGKFWHVADVAKLLLAKRQLKARIKEWKAGKRPLPEVYEPFNRLVLAGRPYDLIDGVYKKFARDNAQKMDGRVLRSLDAAQEKADLGIVSTSCSLLINYLMEAAGYSELVSDGLIFAHHLDTDYSGAVPRVNGLTTNLYGRKADVVEKEFFDLRPYRPESTFYLGDSTEDELVADLLPRGRFIVPFYATGEFRNHMASEYGAFVPANEKDLQSYLLHK